MSETSHQQSGPPPIRRTSDGSPEPASIADLIEWFLGYDERTARIRHPQINELFLWKQADDESNGVATYPFENAEARFAIGVFQALRENNSEPLLALWLNDLTAALHEAKKTRAEIAEANKIDEASTGSAIEKAESLTTRTEKRLYLSSCWIEALCTAEARILGWAYQEIYGRPFAPST
ncbi:MAG TPA: hypothetical protein PKD26_04360 [Pyrinomonadaceae bacterium]|nr:hypothetical protein [Pyrinomonadaceae bacterium]